MSDMAKLSAKQHTFSVAQRMQQIGTTLINKLATVLPLAVVSLLVFDFLYCPDRFVVNKVAVQGQLQRLQSQELQNLVWQQQLGNFFAVDLEQVKARVETHPWVQQVQVYRQWPDTLVLTVSENRPLARWHDNEWLNSHGKVLNLPLTADDLEQHVMQLQGREQDAPLILKQALAWQQQLAVSGLEVRQVSLSDSHAWRLLLAYSSNYPFNEASTERRQGLEFELLLGREDRASRMARFQNLFNQHFRYANQALVYVDARYPDGLAIKSSAPNQIASAIRIVN